MHSHLLHPAPPLRAYSPFGVALEGRSWSAGSGYRYGFQAQEQDTELWEGSVNYKYRVEDPRLGRFFSVDPLSYEYPWNSNSAFSENEVIAFVELEGLEKGATGAARARPVLTNRQPMVPRSAGTSPQVRFYRRQEYKFNQIQNADRLARLKEMETAFCGAGMKIQLDEKLEPKLNDLGSATTNNFQIQLFQIFVSTLDEGLKYVKKYGYASSQAANALGLACEEMGITDGKSTDDASTAMAKIHKLEFEYQNEFNKTFNLAYDRLVYEAGGEQNCTQEDLTTIRERSSCYAYNSVGWNSPMQMFKKIVDKLIDQGTLIKNGNETVETVPTINTGQ